MFVTFASFQQPLSLGGGFVGECLFHCYIAGQWHVGRPNAGNSWHNDGWADGRDDDGDDDDDDYDDEEEEDEDEDEDDEDGSCVD